MASIDEELARATSHGLSMGAVILNDLQRTSCVLPSKRHHALYNNNPLLVGDISMAMSRHCTIGDNNSSNSNHNHTKNIGLHYQHQHSSNSGGGVPCFPDFPEVWQGESSSTKEQKNRNKSNTDQRMSNANKKHNGPNWKKSTAAKSKRQQRRLIRKAVNVVGTTTKAFGMVGKDVKKRQRDERRLRRIEKVVKLQQRRRRKRDMGDICRGLASIRCK